MAKTKSPKLPTNSPVLPSVTNPDGVKAVYINNMDVLLNALEARLLFNEITADSAGALTIERRASIVMSLQHFLAMAQVLRDQMPGVLEVVKGLESAMRTMTPKNATEA
jgi:hypothetical protein